MSDWTWKPCRPGDRYCITPIALDGTSMPYTVAKIVVGGDKVIYEAWHRAAITQFISQHADASEARQACANHWDANR